MSISFNDLNKAETLTRVRQALISKDRIRIEGLNVAKLIQYKEITELKKAMDDAELVHIDGSGIYFASKLLSMRLNRNYPGIDLMHDIAELGADCEKSVFLLGATCDIVKRAASELQRLHPTLSIAGYHDGYFEKDSEREIVHAINNSGAAILFIGITSPKKELFLERNWQALHVDVAMGVGGSFDVVSGTIKRAPKWMQRTGLEWLFRIYQEPGRLWKRYLVTNFKFLILVLRELYMSHSKTH